MSYELTNERKKEQKNKKMGMKGRSKKHKLNSLYSP